MLPGAGKNLQGQGSIIFDYEGAPCTDSYYRGTAGAAGAASSAMPSPDGTHKRQTVSGRTEQDVIEAPKAIISERSRLGMYQRVGMRAPSK